MDLELQALLESILGSEFVYFQPPSNVEMNYPCFLYELDDTDTVFADNKPYRTTPRYQLTIIQRTPDMDLYRKVVSLPMCTHTRTFRADKLYHHVFNLYF